MNAWNLPLTMEEERPLIRKFMIALYETPGIGWASVNKALHSSLWRIEQLQPQQLTQLGVRPMPAAEACRRWNEKSLPAWESALHSLGGWRLTPLDEDYPEPLREIPQPPWLLYGIGRGSCCALPVSRSSAPVIPPHTVDRPRLASPRILPDEDIRL